MFDKFYSFFFIDFNFFNFYGIYIILDLSKEVNVIMLLFNYVYELEFRIFIYCNN